MSAPQPQGVKSSRAEEVRPAVKAKSTFREYAEALLVALALALFIHLRVTVKLGPCHSAALMMAVFVVAFLTFFGVPFISTAPHQGAV